MDANMATIVVGVLSLVGTLIGTIAGIMTAQKLTMYRIEQLEKKVELMYDSTKEYGSRIAILEKDSKVQWKAIEEIKAFIREIEHRLEKED